ncbi:MAG: DUF6171 family protein [Tepidisphaeraceae bacterium]
MSDDCIGCADGPHETARERGRAIAGELPSRERGPHAHEAATYADRMATCRSCPDLQYGTTCRHCGCLVAVRAWVAEKACPAVPERWSAE